MKPRRGEVWNVRFDPSVGAEIQKIRPAVVMSVVGVGRLPLCIVVPITNWRAEYAKHPWFVYLPPSPENGLSKDSGADAFQVKSVSESRCLEKLGTLAEEQTDAVAVAIALCVGYGPP